MADGGFDTTRKFVRVLRTLTNGMIEFEFAIGEPELAAELVMPKAAFEEFCRANRVEMLPGAPEVRFDADAADADFRWNLHQATHQRFR